MDNIRFTVTHRSSLVQVEEPVYNRLLSIASWQERPRFPSPGRTAWHVFDETSLPVGIEGGVYRAAKLKGIGVWNPGDFLGYSGMHDGYFSEEPTVFTTQEYPYTSSLKHVGFTESGGFTAVCSDPAPYGGMLHERAIREFDNGRRLFERGIPVTAPLAVIRYDDHMFRGRNLGAVISLSPTHHPYRLQVVLFADESSPEQYDYYAEICACLGITGDLTHQSSRLMVLERLGYQLGKMLRDFARSGLYRHSGGVDNLLFDPDTKQVLLTDLDSSRELGELPVDVRPLQILRDLASMLYKLPYRLLHPKALSQFSLPMILEIDPLPNIICGFFPNASTSNVREITKMLWYLYCRTRSHDYRDVNPSRLDQELFFSLAITSLFPIYQASDLFDLYPCSIQFNQLLRNVKRYLGNEKYDDFLGLLSASREMQEVYQLL